MTISSALYSNRTDEWPTPRSFFNELNAEFEFTLDPCASKANTTCATFFTKKDGRYDFDDLSFTVDYKLQARWKTLVSDSRNLSQYDRAAKIVRILQVATPEGKPIPSATAKKEDPK